MHNSFKTGATSTEWKIGSLLSSLYYLFKDSPARREDYVKVNSNAVMPLKFVSHRWLENVSVCQRTLEIWESIELYMKAVENKQFTKPDNKSYEIIKQAVKDKLIKVTLQFFLCIAIQLQPILTCYQTDRPMICFLSSDLCAMIGGLMRKFIKPDVLSEANSADRLSRIDIKDKKNHVTYNHVDIGILTERALKNTKGLSEKQLT